MHIFHLLICSTFSLIVHSQTFDIPAMKSPYYDIIEWKGMGGILLSKDASGTRQINLTLVGDQETSIWDQKFTPKSDEFYYLASENARYVYFLDNLELNAGKVYFSQLNSAGNVKSNSVAISNAIKKLGDYDYNNLELINVVVTDKALVHHFRYEDKKAKSIREFATFITHHNFLCYAAELGAIPMADLKNNEDIGQWNYIGFTGDKIYFAAREKQAKQKGWAVKEFTSKARLLTGTFMDAPEDLIRIENIGFGTTGIHYLEGKSTMEAGLLTQINGKYYMMGAQSRNGGADIILYERKEGEWTELNSMNLNYFLANKPLKLGVYPLNEGIGYHLDHNGYNKVSIISNDGASNTHNDFLEQMIYNPSSVIHPKKNNEFVVDLPGKILYFNTDQLGQAEDVTFELKAK